MRSDAKLNRSPGKLKAADAIEARISEVTGG